LFQDKKESKVNAISEKAFKIIYLILCYSLVIGGLDAVIEYPN